MMIQQVADINVEYVGVDRLMDCQTIKIAKHY